MGMDTFWLLWGLSWLVYYKAILAVFGIFIRFIILVTSFPDRPIEQHCHILDAHEKMIREIKQIKEREVRDEFQAEPLFILGI